MRAGRGRGEAVSSQENGWRSKERERSALLARAPPKGQGSATGGASRCPWNYQASCSFSAERSPDCGLQSKLWTSGVSNLSWASDKDHMSTSTCSLIPRILEARTK